MDEYHFIHSKFEEMRDAADLLITYLPGLNRTPYGWRFPDVDTALDVLPGIREFLVKVTKPDGREEGPRPNDARLSCARVVVEAWQQGTTV